MFKSRSEKLRRNVKCQLSAPTLVFAADFEVSLMRVSGQELRNIFGFTAFTGVKLLTVNSESRYFFPKVCLCEVSISTRHG
jgi:hypothetical protein